MNRLSMFLRALVIVGVAELLVMLLLRFLGLPEGIWKDAIDAALLTALSAPFLYVWVAQGMAGRLSEKYIQGFLESARDLVQSVTPEGRFLYVNRAWRETLGYREDEVPRLSLFDIIHPDHRIECQRLMQRVLGGEPLENVEVIFVSKDGRNIFVSGSVNCVLERGKPMATQAIFRDVTERKRAETERLQLLAAIEQASDAVVITNLEGQIQYVNSAFTKIAGYSREEVLEQNPRILKSGQHDAAFYESLWRRIGAGEIWQGEIINRKRDGTFYTEWMTITPVRDGSGKIANYIAIQGDITERKRMEREVADANRQLKSWLAELERRTCETTLLNEMGDLLLASLSPEEAHAVITQYAPRLFPDDSGAVFAISASRDLVEAVSVWGETPPRNRVFATGECWALRRGRLHGVDAAHSGLTCKHLTPAEADGYLCVPMMAQGEALGVLHVQDGAKRVNQPQELEESLTESKQRLAVAVAEHLALALANLNLRETLRTQSIRDPLTGLFNRRYMEESLEREMRRAARNHKPLGAIMIDLDHFKRFNDTFGHEAGDTLLRVFGDLLQKRLRGEDIACRYGGEEFVLILPEAALEVVRQRGEELRERAKHLDVQHLGRALGAVTLSLGVAVFPEHGGTPDAVLRAADWALYRAKKEGRDRVVVAETVTE